MKQVRWPMSARWLAAAGQTGPVARGPAPRLGLEAGDWRTALPPSAARPAAAAALGLVPRRRWQVRQDSTVWTAPACHSAAVLQARWSPSRHPAEACTQASRCCSRPPGARRVVREAAASDRRAGRARHAAESRPCRQSSPGSPLRPPDRRPARVRAAVARPPTPAPAAGRAFPHAAMPLPPRPRIGCVIGVAVMSLRSPSRMASGRWSHRLYPPSSGRQRAAMQTQHSAKRAVRAV